MTNASNETSVPLVSVIILNYNGLKFAEQCVRSVLQSDYPNLEVVIVDNASTDGSYELLYRSFGSIPSVRILRNSRNTGFAEGNNVGYNNSKGDVLVFLNIDTRVERRWLSELVRALRAENVGGAQSKIMSLRDPRRVESVGHDIDWLGFVYSRPLHWAFAPIDHVQQLFYPEGASMAYKRAVLEEVCLAEGPFDSEYFFYFEDNDLGWRIRLRGYSIILVLPSVAYHYVAGSGSPAFRYAGTFSFSKNRMMTLTKNYGLRNLVWILPLAVLLEIFRAILLLAREPTRSLAKLTALLWWLRNLHKVWKKRVFVQSYIRKIPDSELMRHMLSPNFARLRRSFDKLY